MEEQLHPRWWEHEALDIYLAVDQGTEWPELGARLTTLKDMTLVRYICQLGPTSLMFNRPQKSTNQLGNRNSKHEPGGEFQVQTTCCHTPLHNLPSIPHTVAFYGDDKFRSLPWHRREVGLQPIHSHMASMIPISKVPVYYTHPPLGSMLCL